MANRYWVGGTATWDATAGSKWSTTSGGGGGSAVPTAADDVFLDAASGAVTITTSGTTTDVCRSLNCTGFTGTLSHAAATTISIGDGTAGAGNVALLLVAGMTYTVGSATTSIINFVSTSATVQTITSGGKTMPSWTINGAGSSYQLADANTVSSTSLVTLTTGTLNTNNQTCSWGGFSSAATGVRTLTLGTSTINLTGVAATGWGWLTSLVTNFTFSGLSSTINSTVGNFNSGPLSFGTVNVTIPGVFRIVSISGSGASFANLSITGNASKLSVVGLPANTVVTGNLTLAGLSDINRLQVAFANGAVVVAGTTATISAGSTTLTNVDFQDIAGTGAAAWTGTSLGDCGGNTGITFDAPATQTHTASAGGNWSDPTKWTSRVPLPQDNVVVNVNTTGTLTSDMPRSGANVDFTGFAGTWVIGSTVIYGNLTQSSGMTITSVAANLDFGGRGSHTITTAGKTLPPSAAGLIRFLGANGTYTLQDSFTTLAAIRLQNGTLDTSTNNYTLTCLSLSDVNATSTRTLQLRNSTVNLTSTAAGAIYSFISTALTLNTGSSTIIITNASVNSRSFTGAGGTYGTLTYTVANSPGPLVIAGANTFTTLNIGAGRVLTMPSSTVNTFTTFNANGSPVSYVYIPGVAGNYISTPDSAALSVTGSIDIRVRVALDDWTPAAISMMVGKLSVAGQYGYDFWVNLTTGRLVFRHSADGTALVTSSSTASPVVTDGSPLWVRVTRDSVSGDVKFYTAADSGTMPAVWTQLGTTVASAASGMFNGTTQVEIGTSSNGVGNLLAGKMYQVQIRNNVLDDGSGIVFDANLTTKAFGVNTFAESSSNAATVTLNGSTLQASDGRVLLDSSTPGTAATISKVSGSTSVDYLTIRDSAAAGGATWFAGANSVSISNNTGWNFKVPFELGGSFFHVM